MSNLSRRCLLRGASALVGAGALGACTVTTRNGVTTIAINVTEFTADATVALNVVKTVLGFTGVPSAVVTATNAAIAAIEGGLAALKTTAGASVTLTFDSTSVPGAVSSLIADIRLGASDISAAAALEGSAIGTVLAAEISSVSADVARIASLLQGIVTATVGISLAPEDAARDRVARIAAIKMRHGIA
ncbi:hypothetical protein [Gluconacetobacter diazotrophicus]|uniref:Putative exported protein n=1 Tax=Gluconacetobacter diazotrophicus (strain ATCC 49037 / DSM 5601 / CCUG 37298 / CIP 103539 / LMG 7603 / PAl5) TaxID=272568 RepID=A9H6H8_GLUDA|nr:hypothetical protein [Gluconacetobacter diazotrophicus]CAP57498.1 putative exported protein [Gluconacetobacter diazotrophicus PA1 5]